MARRPHAVGELATPAGTRRIYRLNPAGVAALRDQLDTYYWNRALANDSDLWEQDQEKP